MSQNAEESMSKALRHTTICLTAAASATAPTSPQAPEQFEGRPVNEKVDIYSFGVLLWECLSGKQPWAELDHPMQVSTTGRYIAFTACMVGWVAMHGISPAVGEPLGQAALTTCGFHGHC